MTGIDVFAWVVLLVMIASVVAVFVVLGMLPGKVARQRKHPQAEAINVASWLALIFGFAAWPFVLVWAYLRPIARPLELEESIAADASVLAANAEQAAEGGQVQ
jgi:uncharacterized membrane protein YkvI